MCEVFDQSWCEPKSPEQVPEYGPDHRISK